MSTNDLQITKETIEEAHARIGPVITKTPLKTSDSLNRLLQSNIWFKCENLQVAGAFKTRGALNAVLSLSEEEASKGVVTHSSGNHAQSLAFAARQRGIPAYIVMPETAPDFKVQKVKSQGAQIRFCENNPESREKTARDWQLEIGAHLVHPFDNEKVIGGQATVAKEMLEEMPDLEIIVPPVGGGGLLAGSGLSALYYSETCKVIAAEPEGAADAYKSFQTGNVEKADFVKTYADGLQTHLSELTLSIIRNTVSEIWLTKEETILQAMKLVYDYLGMYIEPSSAVPLALVLDHPDLFAGKKIGLIITGGNIDPEKAKELIAQA